jgi:AcrB/AcrD/AcrF family
MTTSAMVVAMVPLLIAKGAGAASRFDIGVVIAAGMTIGTLFTLFVTPAIYTYLARDHHTDRTRAAARAGVSEPATVSVSQDELAAEAEIDAAAEAGMLFPAASEPEPAEPHLAEVLAFSAAAAASGRENRLRRAARRARARKPLTPAAE